MFGLFKLTRYSFIQLTHHTFCLRQGKPLVWFVQAHPVLLYPADAPHVLPATGQTSCLVCSSSPGTPLSSCRTTRSACDRANLLFGLLRLTRYSFIQLSHHTFCLRQGKPVVRFVQAHPILLYPAVAPNILPATGQTSCLVCSGSPDTPLSSYRSENSRVGHGCSWVSPHMRNNSTHFMRNMFRATRPFSPPLTSMNHWNAASRISGATGFLPPPAALNLFFDSTSFPSIPRPTNCARR